MKNKKTYINEEGETVEEYDDEDGHKTEIHHIGGLTTILHGDVTQQYEDNVLKPEREHHIKRQKNENVEFLSSLRKQRKELKEMKNDPEISDEYKEIIGVKLENIESEIAKIKQEMQKT